MENKEIRKQVLDRLAHEYPSSKDEDKSAEDWDDFDKEMWSIETKDIERLVDETIRLARKEGWREGMTANRSDGKANIKLDKVIYEEIKFQKKQMAKAIFKELEDGKIIEAYYTDPYKNLKKKYGVEDAKQ